MDGNFKVKCLNNNGFYELYTIGKIYEIKNGIFENDYMVRIISVNEIEDLNRLTSATWKLIEEEGENKMEDLRELLRNGYVVEHLDEKLSKVEMNENEELIISGGHFFPIGIKLDENLNYDKGLGIWAGSGIKTIYGFSKYNSNAFELLTKGRKVIWKCIEKSPQQIEIESIEQEQRKLADRISKLKEGI